MFRELKNDLAKATRALERIARHLSKFDLLDSSSTLVGGAASVNEVVRVMQGALLSKGSRWSISEERPEPHGRATLMLIVEFDQAAFRNMMGELWTKDWAAGDN